MAKRTRGYVCALLTLAGCQQHAECFVSRSIREQHSFLVGARKTVRKPSVLVEAKQTSKVEEQDWRAFRAKLVLQERQDEDLSVAATSEIGIDETALPVYDDDNVDEAPTWAYESGTIIEQGTVLLNQPPPTTDPFNSFSLGCQYFHKSVMLVLEHDLHTTTTSAILNRPTDLTLEDDGFDAQIWYGGPIHGIHSDEPKFYCLHNLQEDASPACRNVIHGIGFTTIENAKLMVQQGEATASDFWVFCGFCEFESQELIDEVEQHLWHSVSTDGKTLRNGLRILNAGAGLDARNAGISTWSMLMRMIGKTASTAEGKTAGFDDLMLSEWATKNLVFEDEPPPQEEQPNKMTEKLRPGTIVRGSQAVPSPFLLNHQEFHKSLVLVIQDDENFSVGVLLNHPTHKHVDLEMLVTESVLEKEVTFSIPVRFGGAMDIEDGDVTDESPLFFLHNKAALRKAGIGEPVGPTGSHIWRCTSDDAAEAIAKNIASSQDFIVIKGFVIWGKDPETGGGGLGDEIKNGNFEVVPEEKLDPTWEILLCQKQLSRQSLNDNVEGSMLAWKVAGGSKEETHTKESEGAHRTVFNSNVKVSSLCDEALKVWTEAFFLG